jgi:plasmid maintenance system antidote protein VapI
MPDFDELTQGFQPKYSQHNGNFFSPDTPPQPTPEHKDLQRLESEIQRIFASRVLLNQALATFLSIAGATATTHLMARLGIPTFASSTIGGILIALLLGHALTKVTLIDGKPSINAEFISAIAQTLGATGAIWLGSQEHRELSKLQRVGEKSFLAEVKAFEIKPLPPDIGRLTTAGIGLGLLLLAIVILTRREDGGH